MIAKDAEYSTRRMRRVPENGLRPIVFYLTCVGLNAGTSQMYQLLRKADSPLNGYAERSMIRLAIQPIWAWKH